MFFSLRYIPWTEGCREEQYVSFIDDLGIILSMGSANERPRYIVTLSRIGWAHT